jgi:hypothetical protein
MLALLGKPVDQIGTEIPFTDVKVGDVIVFALGGWVYPSGLVIPDKVIDTDVVVKVDDKGAHFDCGTYIAAADKAADAKVIIVNSAGRLLQAKADFAARPKVGWWNTGDAALQWALNDPAMR